MTSPEIRFTPFNAYDDEFQQLSVLDGMGYPVRGTIIRNDDSEMHNFYADNYSADEIMRLEAPLYPR